MFFQEVLEAKADPIFGLNEAFQADPRPNKVNLVVGIYKDDALRPVLMPSVKRAKDELVATDFTADYLPIDGFPDFYNRIGGLVFGENLWAENQSRIYAGQTIGGTGAIQIGGQFLSQEGMKSIVIPNPTWPTHRSILERAGCTVDSYAYYDRKQHGVDFEALLSSLSSFPEKTAVLLHTVCHNPTGCDLSVREWEELSRFMKNRKLLPFFDFAYHGLGEGIEKDRKPIEIFLEEGHEMIVAYSCSKNFSLYCQRVGALFIVEENGLGKRRIGSQVKRIMRSLYSNPPAYGCQIVAHLLQVSSLRAEWEKDLASMRHRIASMRESLIQRLSASRSKTDFQFLLKHKGMFSFIDLEQSQVHRLIHEFGIFLTDNGRISLSGLSSRNIEYVVKGLIAVCESK